jgi:hypothetical protein
VSLTRWEVEVEERQAEEVRKKFQDLEMGRSG